MLWWWVLLLFPLPAIADSSNIGSAVPPISEALIWGVIGACAILLTLWWRYVRPKFNSPSAMSAMKVIAECRLGVKQKLVVVQVGEAQWLLGVTPHSITSLAKLDEPIEAQSAHLVWADWLSHGKD